ncbi:unnamed protein product [Closterium sp. NIES-53]
MVPRSGRELPLGRGGKQYIVLMVEHVSKWLEVRAIPSKSSRHVAAAFKEQVICRFGACAEVLTNQGAEFQGEFKKLLEEAEITHRRTSHYHPQSDGLTERLVQTLKRGLRAYGERRKWDWDDELHWVAAGYRFGKQVALKDHSPYSLLFGCEPVLPVGAPRVLTDTVTAGTIDNWVTLSEARAKYLRVVMPAEQENPHTAQLRDARRYEQRQQQGLGGQSEEGSEPGARGVPETGKTRYLGCRGGDREMEGEGSVSLRDTGVGERKGSTVEGAPEQHSPGEGK